ncbi:gliding motility-associated C-terminal domain-containing protein, partial [Flavobacterium flevense]
VTVLNPIDAKDDGTAISPFATIQSAASATIVGDVTKNDTLNGVPVTGNNTDVTPVTEGPLSIDATGVLSLAPNTPSGNYTINYQLCEVDAVPGNCDTATAYVRVVLIDAANDTGNPITGITGGQSLSNVLTNDTLNGIPATLATVNLTQVSTTNTGVTLNPVNGSVNVAAGTAGGNYLVTYQICDKANPTFCDTATVSVFVEGPSIAIVKTAHFNDEHADGYAVIGETISYSFTITNTGNVPLSNVRITDLLPGIVITGEPITLGIGESDSTTFTATYPLTKEDLLLGSVTNQATAFGTSPLNYVVEDLSDSSSVLTDDSTVLGVTGCTIEVFNAISPNDDGNNDVFYIRGLECYPDNTVEIYNRWGVLVFERSGYNNTDKAFRGISEGRVTIKQSEGLPTGTYFYILKYRDSESKGHEKSGYLYLNRK